MTVMTAMIASAPPLGVVTANLTLNVFPTVPVGGVHENVRVVVSKAIPNCR